MRGHIHFRNWTQSKLKIDESHKKTQLLSFDILCILLAIDWRGESLEAVHVLGFNFEYVPRWQT